MLAVSVFNSFYGNDDEAEMDEVTIYLYEPTEKRQAHALDCWCRSQIRFPVLAAMAGIYLAIPAPGSAVESVFSQDSDIIIRKRSRTIGENLGMMVCLKN